MTLEEAEERFRSLPIVAHALGRLSRELPPGLFYHCAGHTDDVLREVLRFALHDGLPERELELLAIAAAYHDLGFVEKKVENESLGAELAVAAMNTYGGYSPSECAAVRTAIVDTKVLVTPEGPRQVSNSTLSNYLLDADVSNLGRDDFFEKAELVRKELGVEDPSAFLKGLTVFLSAQRWYSSAAMTLRAAGKQRNIEELQRMLANGN